MTRISFMAAGAVAVLCVSSGCLTGSGSGTGGVPKAIAAAVADPARTQADRDADAARKPAESVAFAGVKAGDKVVDLWPGSGYFTRIFSSVVGPKGHVYAAPPPKRPNAPAGAPDPAAAVTAIAADPHFGNVSVLTFRAPDLTVPEPVDVIWTSRNYHDFHNMPNDAVTQIDKTMFNLLKPGGTFIVLDHAAEAGSGARDTQKLHRIDPEIVKKEAVAAGFVFVGSSEILHDTSDPHTAAIFDGSVRGKTDQFILKFRKPKK